MRAPVLLLLLLSAASYAADPGASVYSLSIDSASKDKKEALQFLAADAAADDATKIANLKADLETKDACFKTVSTEELATMMKKKEAGWHTFNFTKCVDPLIGSISLQSDGTSQEVQVNPLNYHVWLGGDIKIPFQLILTGEVAEDVSTTEETEKTNSKALMDTESGAAIRIPLYLVYRADTGFCGFGISTVGRCIVGGDITFNAKKLDQLAGGKETAYGYAGRFGASLIFPVLGQSGDTSDAANQGYFAFVARIVGAHTSLDDPSLLFTPVTDADGNPVTFKESVAAFEGEIKLAINGQISIGARWFSPLNNKDYLNNGFTLSLENKF